MSKPLLSGNWYRVRALRPRLRGQARLHRHAYRGRIWYVLEDRAAGRHHRFNFAAYRVIDLMDGRRDLDAIWQALSTTIDEDTPTQDEIIELLGQLHASDLVIADVSPDVAELLERRTKQHRRKWLGRFANPIALRIPLFDPDRLLERLVRWVRPLLGRGGVLLWLAVVLPALALVPSQWEALTGNLQERLIGADNLLLMLVLFPLLKVLHELAHGVACRMHGGEVHETGVMLLVLYPVPYVDVSSGSAFVDKWQRALLGAAGMLAEMFVAAIAFLLWLLLEPGLARSMAWNVAVLGSVTTLFFNANPLLRYDGYYILADLTEIPNLGTRAARHWQHLAERHVFGVKTSEPPPATAGERRWFVAYQPLSYAYRLFVSFGIAVFVAQQYFVIGVAIALWTIGQSMLWPVFKGVRALATGPQFVGRGARIRTVLGGTALALSLLLFALPMPYHTAADGVLWLPERAILRAGANGFVRSVTATTGSTVEAEQPVLESVDPDLVARIEAQRAKIDETETQRDAAWGRAQARAEQLERELVRERAVLARLEDEVARLTLRAAAAGTLLIDRPEDLPGRYLRHGEVIGYVRTDDPAIVRVVVPQSDVDPVRHADTSAEVRMPQVPHAVWPAERMRTVPAATRQLPSAALGTVGGGQIATDPTDRGGTATIESLFELELALPEDAPRDFLGSRVEVRFTHAPEPIGLRWLRGLRRAFLSWFQA
ncbi:MAG: hypothetical protein RIS35_2514 [Pseudomonadota bacterium]